MPNCKITCHFFAIFKTFVLKKSETTTKYAPKQQSKLHDYLYLVYIYYITAINMIAHSEQENNKIIIVI